MAVYRVLGRYCVRPGSLRPFCHAANAGDIYEAPVEEDLIEQKRNKSRLTENHYRIHHRQVTRLSEDEEIVESLSKQRKLYAHYGASSGISVDKLWPSKEELELEKEWEKVSRPHSAQEMIRMARQAKEDEERATQQRQEELKKRVAKLEGWKREVRERIHQQEKEAHMAKEKKDRLIEEVRQILGFQIDPKDERFKEALLKKEQEEKKAKKAAKKLASQKRLLDRLRKEANPTPTPAEGATTKPEGEGSNISPGTPIV
ncbi:Growth arrest and DNA damage-inducible proteins-interacting protein 1 [Chionoecetes opilio]|uniref:Large ribosomal subunit protein mL64 n=1 Tax=Chionoecetes opilio TaxID=41210 RepID=A0A8J4YLD5_CHIOP|nr:Growth arrest and DNA damage-inducible proteins-interacting protein 1 [Chionoecetes opilio]